jgi:RNA polymerase sigma-70 factor (ECF subfamily)
MSHEGELTPPDAELLERAAAGDREAFSAFVRAHQDSVFRFLRARTESLADCEDALQETFLAAFRGCGSYRGEASPRAWLLGIARNVSARLYRKRAGEPDESVSLEELGLRAGWGAPDPSPDFLEILERRRFLERALDRLPASEKEVIVLRDLEGFSGDETASLLDLSLPAMKSRLHRGRLRLAALLREGFHGGS